MFRLIGIVVIPRASLRKLNKVEVVEGHLMAIATENEHEAEFVNAGCMSITSLRLLVTLESSHTLASRR